MSRVGPRAVRYGLAGVVLFWVALSELGVVVFAYSVVEVLVPGAPALTADSVVGLITSPTVLGVGVVAFATSAALGRRRYGSLAAFTVAVSKQCDSLLGWTLFDEPALVGRVVHNDVAWRFEYQAGDHIEPVHRECPSCGLELVEGMLRRDVVHAPNAGVDPGTESQAAAAEAWTDVFGREKAEDHNETLALLCPQCSFSVPGRSDVLEGADGARAKFRQHVDRMRSGNRRSEPFGQYVAAARERAAGEPTPADVWDAYVRSTDAPDALAIAPARKAGGPRDPGGPVADGEGAPEVSS